MLQYTHRFHGHNSLRYVYKNGKTLRGQYFVVRYVDNPKRNNYRAAVVVSKKVHKSAFVRNRIRRKVYEILREQSSHLSENLDIVVNITSLEIYSMNHPDLYQQIEKTLRQTGSYKSSA